MTKLRWGLVGAERICPGCGSPLPPAQRRASGGRPPRYHNAICRQRAYVIRQRAAGDADTLRTDLWAVSSAVATDLAELARRIGPVDHGGESDPVVLAAAADDMRRRLAGLAEEYAKLHEVMSARTWVDRHAESPPASIDAPLPAANVPPVEQDLLSTAAAPPVAEPPPPEAPVEDRPVTAPSPAITPVVPAVSPLDEPRPERIRVVRDLAGEFGPGWVVTRMEGDWEGRYQVRLGDEVIGTVQRRRSLSGRSTSGWQADRRGLPVTAGSGKPWPSRDLAAAAIIQDYQRTTKSRSRRRRPQ